VDACRKTLEHADVANDETALRKCALEARGLRLLIDGNLFAADSLFNKTLGSSVTEEQIAHLETLRTRQGAALYKDAVAVSLGKLARILDLSAEQYKALEKLVLEATRSPRKFGQSGHAYVMFQMARLPDTRLKPLFHEAQWEIFKRLLAAWKDAAEFLKSDGFIFDDNPADAARSEQRPARERSGMTGQ
jgi:hypothetical protein